MNEQQTQLPAKIEPAPLLPTEFNVFGSMVNFTDAQRMARALCSSSIVPENYRGEAHIGDCLIALEIANRIGANILSVMQNLYIVHGKPAWSSQFLIACVNASRRFSPLRYVMTGDPSADSYGCIAWATDRSGERLESPEITVGIAKAEGWFQKNGSKWKTMPALMLRYRSATLFARLYAPELSIGIQTADEVDDIIDIAPIVTEPAPPKELTQGEAPKKTRFVKTPPPPVDAPEPEPISTPEQNRQSTVATGEPQSSSSALASGPGVVPTEAQQATAAANPELAAVLALLSQHNITPAGLLAFCHREKLKIADTLESTERRNLGNLARALGADKSPMLAKLKEFCKPATA